MKKSKPNDLNLISKSEAAKLLGLGKERINELLETGKIRFLSFKKRIKIPLFELRKFVEENLITGMPNFSIDEKDTDDLDDFFEKDKPKINIIEYFDSLKKEIK